MDGPDFGAKFSDEMLLALMKTVPVPMADISFHPLVDKWICGVPGCRFLHENETAARLCRVEWKLK